MTCIFVLTFLFLVRCCIVAAPGWQCPAGFVPVCVCCVCVCVCVCMFFSCLRTPGFFVPGRLLVHATHTCLNAAASWCAACIYDISLNICVCESVVHATQCACNLVWQWCVTPSAVIFVVAWYAWVALLLSPSVLACLWCSFWCLCCTS